MNYFKVKPDSPLHANISALLDRVKIYADACKAIKLKYNADGMITDDFHFTPRASNLWFKKAPDCFSCRPEHGGWVPLLVTKEGRALKKELESLDLVSREEFALLFYTSAWHKPGLVASKGQYYIEGQGIEKLEDLTEILGSEFQAIRDEVRIARSLKNANKQNATP